MSNDNKTLADVQPGGRVRLGDEAERARFEQYRGGDFERDAQGYYTSPRTAQDWAMWQAALAARQPVGEPVRVSGDMVDGELSVASAIDQVVELFPSADRAALRTLAACFTHHSIYRYADPPAQCAGEPVAWMTHHDEPMLFPTAAEAAAYCEDDEQPVPLFRSPAQAVDLGTGVKAIAAERERQLQAEGFTRDGDQQYRRGELAKAATAYVQLAAMDLEAGTRNHIAWREPAAVWPWAPEWWKPVDARRDLVRAGALIAAQIDAIDSQAVGNG